MVRRSYHAEYVRRNELARSRGFPSYYAERKSKSSWTKAKKYGEFSLLTKGLSPNQALAKQWIKAFDESSGSAYLREQGIFFDMLREQYAKKWLASFKGKPISVGSLTQHQKMLALKAFGTSPEDRRLAGTQLDWKLYRSEYNRLHPKK
jgi:hypothetical protein